MLTFDVPELYRVRVHVFPAPLQEVNWACTWAVDVKDPNKPKTNPETAIAEISVMAMSTTVANTGDMAFLFKPAKKSATRLLVVANIQLLFPIHIPQF